MQQRIEQLLQELNVDKAMEKVVEKPVQWLEGFITMQPNVAVAVLVLIGFRIPAHLTRMWARKGILRTSHNAAVMSAFDANDITIPFPIRTLDFTGDGGQTLAAAWPRQRCRSAESDRGDTSPDPGRHDP